MTFRRYYKYTGGPDPLAPPPDLTDALEAIADDVMAGYSPESAIEEYLRRAGLDDLGAQVSAERSNILASANLGGTLADVDKLLKKAVLAERGQLARDVNMDDTDRAFREMTLDNLPDSTAGAVTELAEYDWQSAEAREAFDNIRDLLGREVLDQRFAGMKQALEGATDADREAIAEMIRDLNMLLAAHRRGEDADFDGFMAKHGHNFPENPRTIDGLIDVLAQRSAAASRLLASMTEEQRRELMELSAQAFGSEELMRLLSDMDDNLQSLRPDLDWTSSAEFSGTEGMGLGAATGAMNRVSELDKLAEQLARGTDVDIESLRRQLGDDAADNADLLRRIEKALRDRSLLRRDSAGDIKLSPQAIRRIGASLVKDIAQKLSARSGQRDSLATGATGEATGATRAWEFGDTAAWDVPRTITNALIRDASSISITPDDIEVVETETRSRGAVALLVDTSFSMAIDGRWVPMKRTALALHHLISTRFRGDELALITFGRYAQTMDVEELTALPPIQEQGTNLHHGLLLAEKFFNDHPHLEPSLLIVTDGEPTSHLEGDGTAWFNWPTDHRTLMRTVDVLERVGRRNPTVTFFQLGDDPGLTNLLHQLAGMVDGRVETPDLGDLGASVIGEYLRWRP